MPPPVVEKDPIYGILSSSEKSTHAQSFPQDAEINASNRTGSRFFCVGSDHLQFFARVQKKLGPGLDLKKVETKGN